MGPGLRVSVSATIFIAVYTSKKHVGDRSDLNCVTPPHVVLSTTCSPNKLLLSPQNAVLKSKPSGSVRPEEAVPKLPDLRLAEVKPG